MTPVIRISDATWESLKLWAIPLEDSPEDVIRRVLAMAEEHKACSHPKLHKQEIVLHKEDYSKSGRLQTGLKIPQSEYRRPILEALNNLGGRGTVEDILKRVEEIMKGRLTDVDYQDNPSGGDVRWRNTAQWERLVMVQDGLLKANSPRGIWELAEKGFLVINS